MSYQINQKISPNLPQPSMGLNSGSLQNVDSERIRQGVNDSPVSKAQVHKDNPFLLLGAMIASFTGVSLGMSKFNASCRGDYKNSTVGKLGDWGDKVASKKIFQGSFISNMRAKSASIKKNFNEKVIPKSKILSALFNTHSVPTNKMVLTMSSGISAELAGSATQMFEHFTDKGQNLEQIKKLGFVKNGQADLAAYQDVIKNPHKHIDVINEACRKQGPEAFHVAEKGGKIPWSKKLFGKEIYLSEKVPFTKNLFCKKHYFSEFTNKLDASKGLAGTAQKTSLGKVLPRQTLRIIEGLTNANTGGGLIGVLMGSYFIADSLVRAIKAPKGEKGKTFTESLIYNTSFYLTMPLAMKLMHSAGGLQYIGMNKDQVETYRKNLEAFNAKTTASEFANKAEWKAGKTQLTDALKGDTRILKTDSAAVKASKFMKNIIYRPLKFAGRVITVGLESIKSYVPKDATKTGKFFRNLRFKMKDISGYPMRIGLFMFVIAPPLAKFGVKCSHAIFGKPTKSVLDEGKEEKEPKAENNQKPPTVRMATPSPSRVQPQPQAGFQPQVLSQPTQNNVERTQNNLGERQNLLEKYKADQAGLATVTAPKGPVRTYVPSSDGVKIDSPRVPTKVKSAIESADYTEQNIKKILGDD